MKKFALLILSCVLYFNAQAQKPFTFGPMIGSGINIASYDASGISSSVKPNGSFLGGAFARVSIKRFYIQPEVYYSNKVANLSFPILAGGPSVESQVKTGNVNVNALLGVKLLKLTGLFNVRAFAGPSTSLIVAKSIVANGSNISTSNLKSSSFNLQAGLGVDITKFTIDVRYEKGFTDLSTNPDNLKINSVLLTLGFKIL